MKLQAQEAKITTVSVEIKTLTVKGKQVTLAVFRQLEKERLLDNDLAFRGLPWGRVNYHPDKCADDSEHVHVVWQLGTELRRDLICWEAPPRGARRWARECREVLTAVFVMRVVGGWKPEGDRPDRHWAEMEFLETTWGVWVPGIVEQYLQRPEWQTVEQDRDMLTKMAKEVGGTDLKTAEHQAEKVLLLRASVEAIWEARRAEILSLPQLFIAV